MLTGLCSVSFRKLKHKELIRMVAESGLNAIEWGSDIHVPVGNTKLARQVGNYASSLGIESPSYGSYYKLVEDFEAFKPYVDAATHLGANNIRVWAGNSSSHLISEDRFKAIAERANEIAEYSAHFQIKVSVEYHKNTLTDTLTSTALFYNTANHPNLFAYWQPLTEDDLTTQDQSLMNVMPRLSNVHLYYWQLGEDNEFVRRPLIEGHAHISRQLNLIVPNPTLKKQYVFLEFVKDDLAENFLEDAKALKKIISKPTLPHHL